MDSFANAGKYKIIEYMANEEAYQAFAAIDIEKNPRDEVLVNRYRGEAAARKLVPVIADIKIAGGEEFVESFTEYGTVCAVFRHHRGDDLERAMNAKRGAPDERAQFALAKSLMKQAILQLPYPLIVRNASLRRENVRVDVRNQRIILRRVVSPDAESEVSLEQARLATCLKQIYPAGFFAPDAHHAYIENLEEEAFEGISAMYSAWCDCAEGIAVYLDEKEKKGPIALFFPALGRWMKRNFQKYRKERMKKKAQTDLDETQNRSLPI